MTPVGRRSERGFTIVEVIVAIMVLTVGLLALSMTAALTTRMIGRGQRSGVVAAFTQRVIEEQRLQACTVRNPGSQVLNRGGTQLAKVSWTWATASATTFLLQLSTTYVTAAGRQRTDQTETTISCLV